MQVSILSGRRLTRFWIHVGRFWAHPWRTLGRLAGGVGTVAAKVGGSTAFLPGIGGMAGIVSAAAPRPQNRDRPLTWDQVLADHQQRMARRGLAGSSVEAEGFVDLLNRM